MSSATTAGLRLAVRGLWFRRSTAAIVFVLAVVASAAAVVAPLYARAAEESILRDTLRRADAFSRSVQVVVPNLGPGVAGIGPAEDGRFTVEEIRRELDHPGFGMPVLAYSSRGVYHPDAGPFARGDVLGQVVERDDLCAHLDPVVGRCPAKTGEGMIARRSLALLGAKVGQTVEMELPDAVTITESGGATPVLDLRIVGAYDPVSVDTSYWGGRPYFDAYFPRGVLRELVQVPPTADPIFVGPGTAGLGHITAYTIDVALDPRAVGLTDPPVLREQIRDLRVFLAAYQLETDSRLPDALGRADEGQELVRIAAPLAATQLVLLAWWTLYLVVGSATEERSPELGLAKLRGLSVRQTRRFGLAEVLLLLLVAAPVGTLVGWSLVRAAAGRVFAPGTEVVLTSSVLLTLLGALAGGAVTAAVAARSVLRRPVSDLLRRVPPRRGGRRAGLVEGVVVALSIAGVVQLISDRGERPSPVALLAPGMLAVAGGLLAGRVLVRVARRRAARALERGGAAGLTGWSGVARRPGTARIAAVLAVATCLLLVGVEAWTVADRNRSERALAETGAAVVLTVSEDNPRQLLSAVRAADPSGRYAMAAVEVSSSDQGRTVVAVDSTRADAVLGWGSEEARPARPVRQVLSPGLPRSLILRPGGLAVTVDSRRISSPSPLELSAELVAGGTSHRVPLGRLVEGEQTYRARVPDACARGCRLAALTVSHAITDLESATATLFIQGLADGPSADSPIAAGFDDLDSWRPGAPGLGGAEVTVRPGPALRVELSASGGIDATVARGDAPEPLPALTGSRVGIPPNETGGLPVVEGSGVSGLPSRFLADRVVPFVPRAGQDALLVDLELALRLSDEASAGQREVWLARDDPGAERQLVAALRDDGIRVQSRDDASALERIYAGDGAVLALRLLLVCGAAAVLVAVGALLVAAYVGRRQRAYEVAALRAVGLRARQVRVLLLTENLGTVIVALACGTAAALLASWVLLPSLPQFDTPSATVAARFSPDVRAALLAVGGLGVLLVIVAVVVAALQMRAGRPDRLREGVR